MARHHRAARLTLAVAAASTLLGLAAAPAQADTVQAPVKEPKVDCAKVKCIALTFDDGPGKYADKLLDTLKKHKAKATFFLEGQYVKSRPAFAKRMVTEGHDIGNHSYTHPHLPQIAEFQIRDELQRTEDLVLKVTGKRPTMIRPPYGEYDEQVEKVATEMGQPIVLWNGGSRDWATKNTDAILKEVLRTAKRDGVILMHDWVAQTVLVMPKLLTTLEKQGYHMVGVSALPRNGRKLLPGEIYPDPEVTRRELETPPV
jgi:peptidoglycan/xylan/chitin deacetylase (PgdA/CDA1 family)